MKLEYSKSRSLRKCQKSKKDVLIIYKPQLLPVLFVGEEQKYVLLDHIWGDGDVLNLELQQTASFLRLSRPRSNFTLTTRWHAVAVSRRGENNRGFS